MNKFYLLVALGISAKAYDSCIYEDYECGDNCVDYQKEFAEYYGLTDVKPMDYYTGAAAEACLGSFYYYSFDEYVMFATCYYGLLFGCGMFDGDNFDYCYNVVTACTSADYYYSYYDSWSCLYNYCSVAQGWVDEYKAAYADYYEYWYDYCTYYYDADYCYDYLNFDVCTDGLYSLGYYSYYWASNYYGYLSSGNERKTKLRSGKNSMKRYRSFNKNKSTKQNRAIKLTGNGYAESYSVGLTAYDEYMMSCYHDAVAAFSFTDVWDWNSDYPAGVDVVAYPGSDCSSSDAVTLSEGEGYTPDCSWEVWYSYTGGVGVFFTINTDNAVKLAATAFLTLILADL